MSTTFSPNSDCAVRCRPPCWPCRREHCIPAGDPPAGARADGAAVPRLRAIGVLPSPRPVSVLLAGDALQWLDGRRTLTIIECIYLLVAMSVPPNAALRGTFG